MLEILGAGERFEVRNIDVEAGGRDVKAKYAVRVPVVRVPSGRELDLWIDPLELELMLREVTK